MHVLVGGGNARAPASDPGCRYDDVVSINATDIAPTVTWGINPGQGIAINETIPDPEKAAAADQKAAIEEALKASKVRPAHTEGYDRGEWILMDYFTFIVHVFTPQTRAFYSLERLWGDAERIEIREESVP